MQRLNDQLDAVLKARSPRATPPARRALVVLAGPSRARASTPPPPRARSLSSTRARSPLRSRRAPALSRSPPSADPRARARFHAQIAREARRGAAAAPPVALVARGGGGRRGSAIGV